MTTTVFNDNAEAGRCTHAINRRRIQGHDLCLRNLVAKHHRFTYQRIDRQIFRLTLRPVIHTQENSHTIRFGTTSQDTETGNVHDALDSRLTLKPLCHLCRQFLGFYLRCPFRECGVDHDEPIIFRRNKSRRHNPENNPGQAAKEKKERHDPFQMELEMSQADAIPVDEAVKGQVEFLEELINALRVVIGLVYIQDRSAHGRRQRQCDEGRNGDGNGDGKGELPVQNTTHAAEETDRYEYRCQYTGNADNRVLYIAHGNDRRLPRPLGIILDFVFDGFDDDDGIIDEQADSQDHGKQGQCVDGEIEHFEAGEGPQQRYRYGDERNQCRAAALKEQIYDERNEKQRFHERFNNFFNRGPYKLCTIIDYTVIHVIRERLLGLFQYFSYAIDSLHGVGIGCQADHEPCRILAIIRAGDIIIFIAKINTGNVAYADHRSVTVSADNNILKLFRCLKAAVCTHTVLIRLAIWRRL